MRDKLTKKQFKFGIHLIMIIITVAFFHDLNELFDSVWSMILLVTMVFADPIAAQCEREQHREFQTKE